MVHRYTESQIDFITQHVKGHSNTELTEMFNVHFELDLGTNQIRAFKRNHKLSSGLDGRFKPDQTPWNKGIKGLDIGGKETQFKKGHKPYNYKPVGYERVDRDGYTLVKVQDDGPWPKRWRHKHKVIWEQVNGPIPKGHVVLFADQNRQNVDLDNLILIPQSKLSTLNKKGLLHSDADLTRTGIIMADIYQKISERKKKANGKVSL